MQDFYLGVKLSISYFSNLPVSFKRSDDLSKREVLASMLFFLPFIGLVLGSITIFIFLLISKLGYLAGVISAIIYMMLYGFIHTEAIIDTVDAIYAKHNGKDAYKVIKESTVGAMGVLYGVGFLIIKVASIAYLFINGLFEEFIAILIISRLSLLILIDTLDFKSSFVTLLKESLGWKSLISSFLVTILIGSILIPYFIIIMIVGFILAFIISIYLGKKLNFINGDVLGATLEGIEILLFLITLSKHANTL
jgi:adenosylcobinamide-GDP ribazoletransferase